MADNRPPVYVEDGRLIIRASAIGHPCLWELIAAGQQYEMLPPPAILQRAWDEGNMLEPLIVKRLEKEYGIEFSSHQKEAELWLSDDVAIRYHPDGIGILYKTPEVMFGNSIQTHKWYVVEIKALTDSLWQLAKRTSVGNVIEEYNWQMAGMMEGEQLPGLWVAMNKGLPPDAETGERPPCADAGKLLFEQVNELPVSRTELELKASLIKEGVLGEDVVSSDRQCDSPDHWPCRYLYLRPEKEGTDVSISVLVVGADDKQEVDRLVREYLVFKGQADEGKQRYEAARDELVRLAGDHKYIQTDKYYVPVVNGASGQRIDWQSMSQELKAAIEKYKRPGTKYKYLKNIKRLEM